MGPIPSLTFPINGFDQEFLQFPFRCSNLAGNRLKSIILTQFLAAVKMSPIVACARVGGVFPWRVFFFETQQIQKSERPDHGHSVRDEPKFIEGQPLYVHRRSCTHGGSRSPLGALPT